MRIAPLVAFLFALALGGVRHAGAQSSELNLVCSFLDEWCQLMAISFERETGIRVALIRRSTGEAYAAIRAEAQNPRTDVWWGGTGDPHLQAARENLTEEYRSPLLAELHQWAVRHAEQSGYRSVGVISGALGITYNADELARRGIAEPRCWTDLLNPQLRNEVQTSDPEASGTAYTMLVTLVTLMGEDPAFAYMLRLHANVNQYTRSGGFPARAVATGETLVGITFVDNALVQIAGGAGAVRVVTPCEGTGYEIGAMSIVRGARNMAAARRYYDWALSARAQALGVESGNSFSFPSNRNAPSPRLAPRLEDTRLVDYDFARFGAPETRRRLLERFNREIRRAPR
jgi:iron(III) transport system substrate-binding protein